MSEWLSILLCFSISTLFLSTSHCKDIASAIGKLRYILDIDRDLTQQLDNLSDQLKQLQQSIDQIRNYELKTLHDMLENKIQDFSTEDNLKHPTDQLIIIKRFYEKWKPLHNTLSSSEATKSIASLSDQLGSQTYLTNEAMTGILRLQHTYNIPAVNFSIGLIGNYNSKLKFAAHDLVDLGIHAYQQEDYASCSHYLQLAEDRLLEKEQHTISEISDSERASTCTDVNCNEPITPQSDTNHQILEMLGSAYDYHHFCEIKLGNYHTSITLAEKALNILTNNERIKQNINIIKDYIRLKVKPDHNLERTRRLEDDLCKRAAFPEAPLSEEFTYNKNRRKLNFKIWSKCHYYHNNQNPNLLIQPIKLEILSDSPQIEFWHNFLSDFEVEELKQSGLPQLERSTVAGENEFETSNIRVSQSSWFSDKLHPNVNLISKRINHMTNLTMETADDLQVANYGVGGQYEAHYDFALEENLVLESFLANGNRVATVLMYLSEVELGGTTAFTELGLSVTPEKGGAVFWYNLRPDGSGIVETKHAACPVIVGVKWIANKWLRYYGQQFVYQCSAQM